MESDTGVWQDGILGGREGLFGRQVTRGKHEQASGSHCKPLAVAMTRIKIASGVLDDFDRFFDRIAQFDVGSASERIGEIWEAVQILASSPMMGHPVKGGKRELVIGRASRGCVALYRYVVPLDTAFVLAIRSQRGPRYKRNG